MDSLYEHVHDDGDPIQGSGGVADNSSWLTSTGENKIALFDGHRTATSLSRRLQATNRTLDPIEYLPPELSTFVIAQALPPATFNSSPSVHSSRLIELTTVSKKWQSFLLSTPVLWSQLYIDGRQEDFLATLSVFVRLSSDTPVTLFLRGQPTGVDWTGLGSILLPGAERVTHLHFGIVGNDAFEWVSNALSNLLDRLCRLPQLQEVKFDTINREGVSLFRIKSFGLPSIVKFNGLFRIKLPESCWASGTLSRFFDVTNCNTLGTLGRLLPPSRPDLLLFEYLEQVGQANIISNGATLLQLESLSERLTECTCFEQVVQEATFPLHHLQVDVDLSQIEDLLDCLRMLAHLKVLELQIRWGKIKIARDHDLSNTARIDLRRFDLYLVGGVENPVEAQKPLSDLFSTLGILYPGVEEVHIRGNAWIGLEASYLQDLKALKSLALNFQGSPLPLPPGSITLQSVESLEIRGVNFLDTVHTPNLLKLVLQLGRNVTKLGPFPRGLRSLSITVNHNTEDFDLTSLDCPDLRDLYLPSRKPRASWGRLRLSNLVSIKIGSRSEYIIHSSSNQLCTTLLCHPWQLPSLRELHFAACVEWDVLFLMLERRNCDESGVQRINTVTLPFIPFAFHKLLARLLAGEIVELPSLTSLSLEATRQLIFDPSVPGCFACMKSMRPGCTARAVPRGHWDTTPTDILYPAQDPVLEGTPKEIRDWLSQRWELVETWKASYEEFALNFTRQGICDAFPNAPLLDFSI